MYRPRRTRGVSTRRGDAETARATREQPDQGLLARSDACDTPPETHNARDPSPTPVGSYPSPPATVETDDKKTSAMSSPGQSHNVEVAAQPPVTLRATRHLPPLDTQRHFQQSDGANAFGVSLEIAESPASAPNSPTHRTLARDAPLAEASSKTRTVKFSRHVHGFRFTKAERAFLMSVFDRYEGKTPSRETCEAIADAFTKSPARDPTSRSDEKKTKGNTSVTVCLKGEVPPDLRHVTPIDTIHVTPSNPPVSQSHLKGVGFYGGAFRGAALRDAVGDVAYFPKPDGGDEICDDDNNNDTQYPVPSTTRYPVPDTLDSSLYGTDYVGGGAHGFSTERATWSQEHERLGREPSSAPISTLHKSKRETSLPLFTSEHTSGGVSVPKEDVSRWQPTGTSVFVGETADEATPALARQRASPSPSPSPPVPVPYLPEQPALLASETIGKMDRLGSFRSDTPNSEPDSFGNAHNVTDVNSNGRNGLRVKMRHGAVPPGSLDVDSPLGDGAYAPGVTLDSLVNKCDDDLTAALAFGACTGRWIPLENRDDTDKVGDALGDSRPYGQLVVGPSPAETAAMVAGAVSELGDGETHPVTWKQIKTWFENRRMTQKRIKEGSARPSRRNTSKNGTKDEPECDAVDDILDTLKVPKKEKAPQPTRGKGKPPSAPSTRKNSTDAPPTARRSSRVSMDETRFDAGGRQPHGVKRKNAFEKPKQEFKQPWGRGARDGDVRLEQEAVLSESDEAAAAAAAAAEHLRATDTRWGDQGHGNALTREMSWADIHDALTMASR